MSRLSRGRQARGRDSRGRGARGRGGDSLPYDAIEALSPDFFAQLRFAVYNGVQVLFQDPACTIPVTEAGNHTIGGVKNPFTGVIILTQPDAAKRPMWMGELVGAKFDGVDDGMVGSFTLPIGGRTVVIGYRTPSAATINRTLFETRGGNGDGIEIRGYTADSSTRSFSMPGTAGLIDATIPTDSLMVNAYRFDEATGHIIRVNGSQEAQDPQTTLSGVSDGCGVGFLRPAANFFDSTISEIVAFSRSLTIPEIEIVEGVLNDQ